MSEEFLRFLSGDLWGSKVIYDDWKIWQWIANVVSFCMNSLSTKQLNWLIIGGIFSRQIWAWFWRSRFRSWLCKVQFILSLSCVIVNCCVIVLMTISNTIYCATATVNCVSLWIIFTFCQPLTYSSIEHNTELNCSVKETVNNSFLPAVVNMVSIIILLQH